MTMQDKLTYVAVHIKLDVCVIRPDDRVNSKGEKLPEEPEAQERNAEVP